MNVNVNMSPTNPLPSTSASSSTATASAASASTGTSYTTTNAARNPTLPAHSHVPGHAPRPGSGPGPGSGGPGPSSATIDSHSSTPQHAASTAWAVRSPSAQTAPTVPTVATAPTASSAPSSSVPPTHPGTGFKSVETIPPPIQQRQQYHHHHHPTLSSSSTATSSVPATIPYTRTDIDPRSDLEGQIRTLLDQQANIQARLATLFAAHYGFDPSHELEMLRHKRNVLEDVVQHYNHQYGMFPPLLIFRISRTGLLSTSTPTPHWDAFVWRAASSNDPSPVANLSRIPTLSEIEEARALQYKCECLEVACLQDCESPWTLRRRKAPPSPMIPC